MRVMLVFFTVAALAGVSFALRELRALPHPVVAQAPTSAPEVEEPEAPRANPPPRSVPRALPFGGVPANNLPDPIVLNLPDEESESHDDIPDVIDRCPDDFDGRDDDDGCPEPEQRTIITEEGRRITVTSQIIIY